VRSAHRTKHPLLLNTSCTGYFSFFSHHATQGCVKPPRQLYFRDTCSLCGDVNARAVCNFFCVSRACHNVLQSVRVESVQVHGQRRVHHQVRTQVPPPLERTRGTRTLLQETPQELCRAQRFFSSKHQNWSNQFFQISKFWVKSNLNLVLFQKFNYGNFKNISYKFEES
jgi:hypothetical protein